MASLFIAPVRAGAIWLAAAEADGPAAATAGPVSSATRKSPIAMHAPLRCPWRVDAGVSTIAFCGGSLSGEAI